MGQTVDDFKKNEEWVMSYRANGEQHFTRSYKAWLDMRYRCKHDGKWQAKYPTYKGCHNSQLFDSPQGFIEWSTRQPGGGVTGFQLDKDLLLKGNKLYSEDVCVYLPQALNKFLTDKQSVRGIYPRGVHFNKHVGKLCAKVSVMGESVHLGYFGNTEEAFAAYKSAKEREARNWANRLCVENIPHDARVIEALLKWECKND